MDDSALEETILEVGTKRNTSNTPKSLIYWISNYQVKLTCLKYIKWNNK